MVRGYLLGPMILATALWIGCGGGTGPSQPNGLVPAPGQVAVTPATMNFGSLAVGSSKSQSGTLTASTADITVQSGLTYYYVATSVNSNLVQSLHSNQTTVVIPTP